LTVPRTARLIYVNQLNRLIEEKGLTSASRPRTISMRKISLHLPRRPRCYGRCKGVRCSGGGSIRRDV